MLSEIQMCFYQKMAYLKAPTWKFMDNIENASLPATYDFS